MLPRTTTLLTLLTLAAPTAALAHAGRVAHVHPHEAPLIAALLLVLGVGAALLFRRRGAV